MKSGGANAKQNSMRYLGNALKLTLGAGAALGGSYLVSRIREKHDSEAGMSRLEQMVEELLAAGANGKK